MEPGERYGDLVAELGLTVPNRRPGYVHAGPELRLSRLPPGAENGFWVPFCTKPPNILPRQARDEHRKKLRDKAFLLQAAADGMLPLVKEIAAWYKALPSEKKYLLR